MVADEILEACENLLDSEMLGARLTVVSGPDTGMSAVIRHGGGVVAGDLPMRCIDDASADAVTLMERERNVTLGYDDAEIFFEILAPRPNLLIFGAVHIAQALTTIGRHLGYRVTVSDSRAAFTTPDRFPDADRLLVGWPGEIADELVFDVNTFLVVLSHDARFEDPLWPLVHGAPLRYIGAMGSKRTAAARRDRLSAAGWSDEELGRIHGPIGLEIGAHTPGEVAIAILGEMTAARYGANRPPALRGESRPIRRAPG